jgi:hypothetical protein
VIVLQDVAFADLHALVEFIYHGEVNVHQRNLSSFLKTAEVLRVSGLTQQAEDRDEVRTLWRIHTVKNTLCLFVVLHFIAEALFPTYFIYCCFNYLSVQWLKYYGLHTFNCGSMIQNLWAFRYS